MRVAHTIAAAGPLKADPNLVVELIRTAAAALKASRQGRATPQTVSRTLGKIRERLGILADYFDALSAAGVMVRLRTGAHARCSITKPGSSP